VQAPDRGNMGTSSTVPFANPTPNPKGGYLRDDDARRSSGNRRASGQRRER